MYFVKTRKQLQVQEHQENKCCLCIVHINISKFGQNKGSSRSALQNLHHHENKYDRVG